MRVKKKVVLELVWMLQVKAFRSLVVVIAVVARGRDLCTDRDFWSGCYRSILLQRVAVVSSHTGYFITQPIRIGYFKHVTELIHSRPISIQDFMGVSTTCKTITKSLLTFPRHVRHTKSHVSTNFILTSYLALQSGRVWPPIDVTPISF